MKKLDVMRGENKRGIPQISIDSHRLNRWPMSPPSNCACERSSMDWTYLGYYVKLALLALCCCFHFCRSKKTHDEWVLDEKRKHKKASQREFRFRLFATMISISCFRCSRLKWSRDDKAHQKAETKCEEQRARHCTTLPIICCLYFFLSMSPYRVVVRAQSLVCLCHDNGNGINHIHETKRRKSPAVKHKLVSSSSEITATK